MLAHNLSSYDDDSFLVAELKKKEEEAVFCREVVRVLMPPMLSIHLCSWTGLLQG